MQKQKHLREYPDRDVDCQDAVTIEIITLIQSAKSAGWNEAEAAAAIMEVSASFLREFTG